MKEDFRDDEILRQYLLHKVPKFCKDKDATEFGKKVMDDLAECLGGQANYRGGKFEPSLFAFYSYNWFKNVTIATADGRKVKVLSHEALTQVKYRKHQYCSIT